MREEARRDDWHMIYVGSDIRQLIDEIERLQAIIDRYEPTHKSLRWYLGARFVNTEEAGMASKQALERFEAAEAEAKAEQRRKFEEAIA
jgi:hypothetical protein